MDRSPWLRMSDIDNRDGLLGLASFASTHSEDEPISLAEYVARMKDGHPLVVGL